MDRPTRPQRPTIVRYEKRCFCGNVIVVKAIEGSKDDKRPEKYHCEMCGRKGDWNEKFVYPKPELPDEIKAEQLPPPVFLDGKPHYVINNKYVPEMEGKKILLERRLKKDAEELEKLNNLTKSGDK